MSNLMAKAVSSYSVDLLSLRSAARIRSLKSRASFIVIDRLMIRRPLILVSFLWFFIYLVNKEAFVVVLYGFLLLFISL